MIPVVSQNWPNWLALLSIVLIFKGVLERWYRGMRGDQNTPTTCWREKSILGRGARETLRHICTQASTSDMVRVPTEVPP